MSSAIPALYGAPRSVIKSLPDNTAMNTNQKILTVVALIVFLVSIALAQHDYWRLRLFSPASGELTWFGSRMLVLVVLYVGLFFILGGKRNGK
jgi:hypothetical protein